jgi:superfamily II DNA helicase RecQ
MSALSFKAPTLSELRVKVKEVFGFRPCSTQVKDALAQLERKDVITIAPTGFGKTLTFWMPLLFNNNGNIIVVTALNILGDQNILELQHIGIKAINITGDNATATHFKVCTISICGLCL